MMNSSPNYQLTCYPIGSLREIWAVSWPLMLGLLSSSLMMFVDRLLLARYSALALNASATAGMATFILMIIPLTIAGISEVFAGQHHGASQFKTVGPSVWQMIWLSIFVIPFFYLSVSIFSPLFFSGTGNEASEHLYFKWIVYLSPAFTSTVALMGFFVGIGQVRVLTISALLGNFVNIGLDIGLIFGYGFFPEMGVEGASLATGLSQFAQTLFLLSLFLKKANRKTYGTTNWAFNPQMFWQTFKIGAPAGLGKFLEIIAHFIFFRIVILSGQDNLTIITVIQSFYILSAFIVEGLSKGVSSIVANLIGGQQKHLINRVLNSACILQFFFFCLLSIGLVVFSSSLLTLFFSKEDQTLLFNPTFQSTLFWALIWMCVFFLFDGFSWIYMGFLTASGDTKFLLYAGIVLNWVFYILPAYLFIGLLKGDASQGWFLMAIYGALTYLTYFWRYRSEKWIPYAVNLTALTA